MSMHSPSRPHRLVAASAAALFVVLGAPSPREARGEAEIVRLADLPPLRSTAREPTAAALIATWLAGYGFEPGKHFDAERYEILDRRVVRQGETGRAMLRFRVLGLDGDAAALAETRCPGRGRPIEAQIFFRWNRESGDWYSPGGRGDPALKSCVDETLWSEDQVALIVDPPPLPAPPKIAKSDVATPPPGSPERKAVLDALRPGFEALFGAPIEFRVGEMRLAAGFGFVSVHPQRPGGRAISAAEWTAAVGPCEQTPADGTAQFWMRRRDGRWSAGWGDPRGVCATDSIADLGYLIGAPPQLIDRDDWGDTDFLPIDDPQYFDLWKK
ncbi:MAG: hypothetical protein LWW93_15890 [Hyphomicrobiales bacterium]|nr:hypothetical protein [Hyphomicrobiales bacterium]